MVLQKTFCTLWQKNRDSTTTVSLSFTSGASPDLKVVSFVAEQLVLLHGSKILCSMMDPYTHCNCFLLFLFGLLLSLAYSTDHIQLLLLTLRSANSFIPLFVNSQNRPRFWSVDTEHNKYIQQFSDIYVDISSACGVRPNFCMVLLLRWLLVTWLLVA